MLSPLCLVKAKAPPNIFGKIEGRLLPYLIMNDLGNVLALISIFLGGSHSPNTGLFLMEGVSSSGRALVKGNKPLPYIFRYKRARSLW